MSKKIYLPLLVVALIFLTVWVAYGRSEKRNNPVRQIWEYKSCILTRPVDGDGTWTSLKEDNVEVGPPFSMIPKLKELGDQGWELVSVVPVSGARHSGYEGYNNEGVLLKTTPSYAGFTTGLFYYFKRTK